MKIYKIQRIKLSRKQNIKKKFLQYFNSPMMQLVESECRPFALADIDILA